MCSIKAAFLSNAKGFPCPSRSWGLGWAINQNFIVISILEWNNHQTCIVELKLFFFSLLKLQNSWTLSDHFVYFKGKFPSSHLESFFFLMSNYE